ncbi:ATPase associated with various cellular activities AAA_3 [Desulfurococcus mucosus DSM 2162]|uniref:ATPase associated with various cellular activities AAA_3 n=2 Tax=Desulfurococcus mucosus TaxID=2275 RepID=E8R8W1_DESM0|nr:MoxR family ATPase [Desulfurococcus mucosus]ADV64937.1 ATPase associated with various cellular activities AAA_3 [Desulfurococcus mucosus DSM 2162]
MGRGELGRSEVERYKLLMDSCVSNIQRKIIGKSREIQLILATLFSQGHVLLEGVPGTAKTLLAKTLAVTLGLDFKRIQATPDLLPSDILGVNIYDPATGGFMFRKGPVFTNILLFDEVNRAPPKTQAALLEAMQERQVTVEGVTYRLPEPFLVIATMNPVETEGTFPLPEAQVDRFLARIVIGYPSIEETVEMLKKYDDISVLDDLKPVLDRNTVIELTGLSKKIYVDENVLKYIAGIVEATRRHPMVKLGASPRGAIALLLLSRSLALIHGRSYVTPDDVKQVAHAALSHRVILRSEARLSKLTPESIIDEVLDKVEPP